MTAGEEMSSPAQVAVLAPKAGEAITDAEIVSGVAGGDARAAAMLWDRYEPLARRLLCRTLGPGFDIADLVQDVFLGVARGAGRLRSGDDLRGYVVGAAMNTARLALRRKGRNRLLLLGEIEDRASAGGAEAVPEAVDAARALAALYRVLDSLSEETRVLFVLRHVEQLDHAQIAGALGLSVPTAKRRARRADALVRARAAGVPELARYLGREGKETRP